MNIVVAAAHFSVCQRTIHNWVEAGHLTRDDRGFVLVPDGFEPPRRGPREIARSERDDKIPRVQQVISALKHGPLTRWQLMERLPGTREAICSAIRKARKEGLIVREDGTWCLTASLAGVCNDAHG